jgi:hypothetical protein
MRAQRNRRLVDVSRSFERGFPFDIPEEVCPRVF